MGHASPHITTMNEGRGAAYEVFKTIDRVQYFNKMNESVFAILIKNYKQNK